MVKISAHQLLLRCMAGMFGMSVTQTCSITPVQCINRHFFLVDQVPVPCRKTPGSTRLINAEEAQPKRLPMLHPSRRNKADLFNFQGMFHAVIASPAGDPSIG